MTQKALVWCQGKGVVAMLSSSVIGYLEFVRHHVSQPLVVDWPNKDVGRKFFPSDATDHGLACIKASTGSDCRSATARGLKMSAITLSSYLDVLGASLADPG